MHKTIQIAEKNYAIYNNSMYYIVGNVVQASLILNVIVTLRLPLHFVSVPSSLQWSLAAGYDEEGSQRLTWLESIIIVTKKISVLLAVTGLALSRTQ